jgi:hypothetical protein
VIFLGNTTVAIASLSIGHVADMGDQSTSGMVLQEEPEHRRRPQPRSLDNNPYVLSIRSMRDEVDAAPPRSDGRPYFPIDHALETVPDFECSASSWTREHLIRLQVVVFKDQADELLFPAEWAVRDDDKTIVKMRADGFLLRRRMLFPSANGTRQSLSTISSCTCCRSNEHHALPPFAHLLKFELSNID